MTVKKDVVHPRLLECVAYTTDIYWKQIFEDMAYGITPYGVYIHKGFLCCNFKQKEFMYKLDNKDPQIMFTDIHVLLKKVGLHSINDKMEMILEMETENEPSHLNKWNTIKKRSIRDMLIENYVIEMKHRHSLKEKEVKKLYNLIQVGLIFKTINAKTLLYINGKIEEITLFSFKDGCVMCPRIMDDLQPNETKIVFVEKYDIANMWKKYISAA
jgi:hypothetical protein